MVWLLVSLFVYYTIVELSSGENLLRFTTMNLFRFPKTFCIVMELGPIPEVVKILHWLIIGKLSLHIGKNSSELWRWQMSVAHSKNSFGVRGAASGQFYHIYLHLSSDTNLSCNMNMLCKYEQNRKSTAPLLHTYHAWKTNCIIWQIMKVRGFC